MVPTLELHLIASIIIFFVSVTFCAPNRLPSAQSNPTSSLLRPHVIIEYPKGTWLENLVIRQRDGDALATLISAPQVQLISTNNSTAPVIVAEIPEVTICAGIVELGQDVFYIIAGNWSAVTFLSTPGSYSIWEIDMRHGLPQDAKLRKVADLPDAGFLNGLAVGNPVRGTLLAADSLNSAVWSVNAYTGAVEVAINDTTMASDPESPVALGINGLLVRDDHLYYTNTDKASFNRIPIDVLTGKAIGPAQTLEQATFATLAPDDFTIDFAGNAWMTADAQNELALLKGVANATTSVEAKVVAGSPTNQRVAGWTAARFGTRAEDLRRGSLYVTTNGGPFNYAHANWTSGGMLVRIDTAEPGIY